MSWFGLYPFLWLWYIWLRSNTATWAESFTKLLAFNQTQYSRVLHLDSDGTVLQSMDDLFLMPQAAVAMPRAYWLGFDERTLSSQIMLVEPSEHEFERVVKTTEAGGTGDYDMEVVNKLYKDKALILPHRPYDLLTGEFAAKPDADHQNYLGDETEQWDPDAVLDEAKYLHFSDWPMPKVGNLCLHESRNADTCVAVDQSVRGNGVREETTVRS